MGWLLKLKKKKQVCTLLLWICLQIKAFNMGVYGIWFVGDNLKWTLKKLQFGALKA